jgi:hypothetical protein
MSGPASLDLADLGTKVYNGVQPFSATEKFLEIVGPPNLARFVRSSLLCRCCLLLLPPPPPPHFVHRYSLAARPALFPGYPP